MLDDLHAFVQLSNKVKTMEAELSEAKGILETMREQISEDMTQAGVNSINISGATVYLRRQTWASAARALGADGERLGPDWERSNAALRAHGLGHLVEEKFNTNSLSAEVRRMIDEDSLPDTLAAELNIYEKVTPVVRRS